MFRLYSANRQFYREVGNSYLEYLWQERRYFKVCCFVFSLPAGIIGS